MITDDKVSKLLAELTKVTVNGSLKWDVRSAPSGLTEGTNHVFPLYFQTRYKGQDIGLAKKRYRYYTDVDEYSWSESILLIFMDGFKRVIWEYEEDAFSLNNLFDLVQRSSVNIDSILDQLVDGAD